MPTFGDFLQFIFTGGVFIWWLLTSLDNAVTKLIAKRKAKKHEKENDKEKQ